MTINRISARRFSFPPAQGGSAIVVVLLVMMTVTVIGVMSINAGVVDLKIALNEKQVRQILYQTEAVAMEGVERLADTSPIDLEEKFAFWHHSRKDVRQAGIDFRRDTDWDVDGQGEDNGMSSPLGAELFMAAVEWRLATGSSAVVTGSRLYLNRVYGLCKKKNGRRIAEIGYYLRY